MSVEKPEPYSVLMSVYAAEQPAYLRQSIESMLAQTAPPDEFVLVCDGPLTVELDAVIAEFQRDWPELFHILRLPENQGLGKALNAGLLKCRNELVARMDSDDISIKDRCALQLAAFASEPYLSVVGGVVAEFEKDQSMQISLRVPPEDHTKILRYAKLRNPMNHPTVMYRRSAVLRDGGYRDAPLHEDYDLWVRMLAAGERMRNLPQVLCLMRVGDGLYRRRGGLCYWRHITRFHRDMYRMGFCSWSQYVACAAVYLVCCLLPVRARSLFYQCVLRKRKVVNPC